METRLHSGDLAAAQDIPAPLRVPWIELGIVVVALVLRLLWLEMKPPHFDEGVNGWFIDRMTEQGYYAYDPTNFHGPLHFYILFLAQTLFGRHAWALRLPIALIGVGCVMLALGFRRYLGERPCQWAGAAMAISPGFVFYSRYAIHETELVFFLMLATWGVFGLMTTHENRRALWAAALGLTGCILTKETYAIHFVAFGLAFPALLALERLTKTSAGPMLSVDWDECTLFPIGGVCLGLIVFFYTGGLLDWSALPGIITTFREWVATGTNAGGGHAKSWHYWLELLCDYEWPALVGLVASAWFVITEKGRPLRWLILSGWAAFFAYSVVHYKTPWCLISIEWPFLFVFGVLLDRLWPRGRLGVAAVLVLATAAFGHAAYRSVLVNFYRYTDEDEPYVYVQTLPALEKITGPLRAHVARNPVNRNLRGYLLFPPGGAHPLPWLLADYPNITLLDENQAPPKVDADLLLIDDPYVSDVEERLTEPYFRETVVLRGNSGESAQLYFRASTFGYQFPDRTPEFTPIRSLEQVLKNAVPPAP